VREDFIAKGERQNTSKRPSPQKKKAGDGLEEGDHSTATKRAEITALLRRKYNQTFSVLKKGKKKTTALAD